jgi:hypothetical protein
MTAVPNLLPSRLRTPAFRQVVGQIIVLRGQRVLLDADLARLYGVSTTRLNQQVRRNLSRFPKDFVFEASRAELSNLMLQSATSRWGGRRKVPLAFTEHGAIMAAMVLNSRRAVEMSVYVVRAFVRLRQVLASNVELARKLEAIERSVAALDASTRKQFEEVYRAIRALMVPVAPQSRPIGFTAEIENKK